MLVIGVCKDSGIKLNLTFAIKSFVGMPLI